MCLQAGHHAHDEHELAAPGPADQAGLAVPAESVFQTGQSSWALAPDSFQAAPDPTQEAPQSQVRLPLLQLGPSQLFAALTSDTGRGMPIVVQTFPWNPEMLSKRTQKHTMVCSAPFNCRKLDLGGLPYSNFLSHLAWQSRNF